MLSSQDALAQDLLLSLLSLLRNFSYPLVSRSVNPLIARWTLAVLEVYSESLPPPAESLPEAIDMENVFAG